MTTIIQCGKTVTLDISEVHPGTDELWIEGDPTIDWGDETSTTDVTGTTISHTYVNIGPYTIVLEGENDCEEICSHTETVVVMENPPNLIASGITQTSARVDWDAVDGATSYEWQLHDADLINSEVITATHALFSGLAPNTTYTVYVSTKISSHASEDYCGDNGISFTTLSETCEIPVCDFTIITT